MLPVEKLENLELGVDPGEVGLDSREVDDHASVPVRSLLRPLDRLGADLLERPNGAQRDAFVVELRRDEVPTLVLTADDVPAQPEPGNNILTNEPHFVGEPILAIAAVDEETAQNALDAIELDLEPLPFCTDPLDSLRPDRVRSITRSPATPDTVAASDTCGSQPASPSRTAASIRTRSRPDPGPAGRSWSQGC